MTPRLKQRYDKEICTELMKRFGFKNKLAVPRLRKITVNMGVGDASSDQQILDTAMAEVAAITGQKPKVTRAKRSISSFKVRAGQPVGCVATLRGARMYEFMDRLINLAVPRVRDFRGLNPNSFDGRGNYSMGLAEQSVFPEINPAKVEFQQGMNITFTTTARTDEEARRLLSLFGMPFRGQTPSQAVS